jgi:D-alanyl-D-alanine carboxypeptidase (penicillin-binding protein 5/6)
MQIFKRIRFSIILSFFLVFICVIPSFAAESTKSYAPSIDAKEVLLINPDTNEILYEKNADETAPADSLTKIMNLYVINQAIKSGTASLDDQVKISSKAWKTGGNRMFLEIGREFPLSQIIKGMAIVNGNDAAVAASEYLKQDTDHFVALMNETAKSIGMKQTEFKTVNGLLSGDKTTARDLGILSTKYLKEFPGMLAIHSLVDFSFDTGRETIKQPNTNPLLDVDDTVDGLFSSNSRHRYNVITTSKHGNTRLIAIVLQSSSASSNVQAAEILLEYGFSQYKKFKVGKKGDIVANIDIYKAKKIHQTDLALNEDIIVEMNIQKGTKPITSVNIPDYLIGGYDAGEKAGTYVVTAGDKTFSYDLVVPQKIERAGFLKRFFDSIALLLFKLMHAIFT